MRGQKNLMCQEIGIMYSRCTRIDLLRLIDIYPTTEESKGKLLSGNEWQLKVDNSVCRIGYF